MNILLTDMSKACTWCGRPNEGGIHLKSIQKGGIGKKELQIRIEHFWFEFCGTCQYFLDHEFSEGDTLHKYRYYQDDPSCEAARLRMPKRFIYNN